MAPKQQSEKRYCLMNYTVQCTDVRSGKTGSFLFDQEHWKRTGEFLATSEVFPSLVEFYRWNKANGYPGKSAYIEREVLAEPYLVTQQIDGDEVVMHRKGSFAEALEEAKLEGGEMSVCAPPRGILAIVRCERVRFTREATDYERSTAK